MKMFVFFNNLAFLTMLTACGINVAMSPFSSSSGPFIGGSVLPLSGLIAKSNQSFYEAYAAPCTDTVYARLYTLDAAGALDTIIASTEVPSSTKFSFDVASLSLDPNVNHMIEISGCNDVYYRPVTNFNLDQDVSYASTLIGYVPQVVTGNKLNDASRVDVEELIKNLNGSSILNSYSNLGAQADLINKFLATFSSAYTVLAEVPPQILHLQVNQLISEGVTENFTVNTGHFDPTYNIVYNWKLNGVTQSTTNSFNYSPGANDQGTKTLSLYIGKDDGGGNIDVTKPYYSRNFLLTIADTLPAIPLDMSMASTDVTSRNITIDLDTDALMANCESFSSLALTEETTMTPIAGAFTITCSSAGTQAHAYTLTSAGDGTKTLRLWARNALGQINPNYKTITVTLDTLDPSASITNIAGPLGSGASQNVSFSASDSNGLSSLKLYFTDDDSTYSFVADLTTSPYAWSAPNTDTATAKLRIIAIDTFGRSTTVTTSAFTIDALPPSPPAITLTSAAYANSTAITMTTASCTDRAAIFINEGTQPANNAVGWQACSTTASATTHTLVGATQGTRTLKAWAKDSSGNVSTTATDVVLVYDTTNPVVALTLPSAASVLAGGTSSNVTFTATDTYFDANPIKFEYSLDGGTNWTVVSTTLANTSPYSWSVPAATNISNARVRVTATDRAGNSAAATSSNFAIDSLPPTLSSFSINAAAATTSSYYVKLALSAADALSNITHFCVKRNSTSKPNLADTCWINISSYPVSLTPATTLSLSDYSFLIGFTPGFTTISAWARDAAGNISDLKNAGAGQDLEDQDTIEYIPPSPPTVTKVEAANTGSASSPPLPVELIATSGDIFVRWKAVEGNGTFGATPISIHYSTDDINYQELVPNVANAQGAGCTLVGDQTGCYQVVNAVATTGSNFFRIRVAATDANGVTSGGTSLPFNISNVKFLAGNTDLGTGNSAYSAMFLNFLVGSTGSDNNTLAVSSTGVVYFRDIIRGVLKIDPAKGIQEIYVKKSTSSTGDGGLAKDATLRWPLVIAMDHQDRLLILDHQCIRRVDTTTNIITTVIGNCATGGSTMADGVAANLVQFTPGTENSMTGSYPLLTAMPNGDILFRSEMSAQALPAYRLRHYHADTGLVSSVSPSGLGVNTNASYDLSTAANLSTSGLSYDTATSAIQKWIVAVNHAYSFASLNPDGTATGGGPAPNPWVRDDLSSLHTGLDGKIYRVHVHGGLHVNIGRYNSVTNAWDTVVGKVAGTGAEGNCADGVAATSCNINPQSVFVNAQGQIFFTDWGRVRTVDPSGNVRTLMGQTYSFGDGGSALSARFGRFDMIGYWNDGTNDKVVIGDWYEHRLREATLEGNIQTIAGTGIGTYPNTTAFANAQPFTLGTNGWFITNSSNGNVYSFITGGILGFLNRSTGKWENLAGGGANAYHDAGTVGMAGNQINLKIYGPAILGVSSTDVLMYNYHYLAGFQDPIANLFDLTDGTMTRLAGYNGPLAYSMALCADGTTIGTLGCTWRTLGVMTEAHWDNDQTRWLIADSSTGDVNSVNRIRTLPAAPASTIGTLITLPRSFTSFTYRKDGADEYIYYCGYADGKLYRYHIGGAPAESELPYGTTGITCFGRTLKYSSTRDSLITIYKRNGLYGVLEYLNP